VIDAVPRPHAPDAVDQPQEYQRFLVGLLGDDDPAAAQESTIGAGRALVADAGDRVRERPEPGEWSVLECLGHLFDAEVVYTGRYRWAVAHDDPEAIGYDQDRWVERLRHREDDPAQLLDQFEALRRMNLGLWRRLDQHEKQRVYVHAERGPESVDLGFRLIAGHDRFHLAQARWALAAVGGALPQGVGDDDAIRRTALDYLEGWFEGDAGRMERALHPRLAKRRAAGATDAPAIREAGLLEVGAGDMVRATRDGGGRGQGGEYEVTILDRFGDAATVKAVSTPFVDYLHVARFGNEWRIVNVLYARRNTSGGGDEA
jgi:hypothetical protein